MLSFKDVKPYPGEWTPQAGKAHELDQAFEVIDNLKEYALQAREYINHHHGLKIASEFYNLNNPTVVGKNISWLTSVSVLKLDPLKFTIDSDDPETYGELSSKISLVKRRIEPFECLRLAGILIPMPTVIEEYDGMFDRSEQYELSKGIIDAGFSYDFLRKQLTEETDFEIPQATLELLLPRVATIPLSTILKIRTEYKEVFTRFQNELIKFIRKSDTVGSEDKLLDLLVRIDGEVHRLQSEFEEIDSNEKLEKQGLIYSFGVMSLALFVPSEVLKSLVALFGSSNILSALRNLRLLEIKRRKLTGDSFYIPFRLSELAKQSAP